MAIIFTMPRGPVTHSCIIRDEPISHIGTIANVERGDFVYDSWELYDGAVTEVGPVCEVCLPVFEEARRESLAELPPDDPDAIQQATRSRLSRTDFVAACLLEYAKKDRKSGV